MSFGGGGGGGSIHMIVCDKNSSKCQYSIWGILSEAFLWQSSAYSVLQN